MRILSIGNSFSEDAHAYLHKIAQNMGYNIETVDLAIGGCSLERHYENIKQNSKSYWHSVNGGSFANDPVSIEEIIKSQEFDVVTLQQVSHFSGKYETYQPYLDELVCYVRKHQPDARLYFHRTWAYEIDSNHSEFYLYGSNQKRMYKELCEASAVAASAINAEIIPAGDVIQKMRERIPAFDYADGGISLCRDGFHMSESYGRYAVALTWIATLTNKPVKAQPFMDLDIDLISKICEIINETVFKD